MKKFAILLSVCTLAACGQEAAEPAVQAQPAVQPESLGLPGNDEFSAAYAKACPGAAAVETTLCKAAGLGKSEFNCEFALAGEDTASREGTLTAVDGEWTLATNEELCTAE
ncbi:hypothetical protein [Altererythrobacter aquiaggeris]|uniref:hypothetical protein n=1 Tax=Aestuarierythrobacter aquiaggeris TaxID=1898396 RepID=UPI003018932C